MGDYWGNANQWGASAQRQDIRLVIHLKLGHRLLYGSNEGGGCGHVAVVSKVIDANTIEVLEANYGGSAYAADPRGGVGNYRGPSTGHHLVVEVLTLFMSRKLVNEDFSRKGLQNFYIAI